MFQNDVIAFGSVRRIVAIMLTVIAVAGMESLAAQEVAPKTEIKKGDTVVVTADQTKLMLGTKTLNVLDKGARLKVVQVLNGWVGAEFQADGKTVEGWIRRSKLSLVVPEPDTVADAPSPAVAADESGSPSPTRSDVVPEKASDTQPPPKASTDESKPAETLAEKFDRMLAERERAGKAGTPDESAPQKPAEEAVTPAGELASQEPPREPDTAPAEEPVDEDSAAPAAKPVDTQAAEQPTIQPTEIAKAAPASTPAVEATKVDTELVKESAAQDPTETPAIAPPAVEATKVDMELVKEAAAQDPTETPVLTKADRPASDKDPQAGLEDIGEGPDARAEKFAQILAERRNQKTDVGEAIEAPSEKPEEAKVVAPPQSDPVQDPPATQQEPEFTISVLVLRNADNLAEVESSELIGQLILSGDQFTNRTLRPLDGLHVSTLSIDAVNVSNTGIQYVTKVNGIRWLRLWSPAIDDRGLKLVGKIEGLQGLDLEGTAVDGSGLEELKGLQHLEQLTLGPKMLDSEVARLASLTSLRQLDLRACKSLTLDCLDGLAGLTDLEVIWLPDQIRTKGKRALRPALPDCQIR